jgi:diguanylate cyclase (GGDEF)-like protein/PAS domain S-box-containing protein
MELGDSHARSDQAVAQRLADLAPFVMFTVDDTGTITWTSGAVERLFGISRAELEGTNILDHIDVDWSPEALDSVGYAMTAAGLQRPMLFRLNRVDGAQVVIEITANAQHDDPHVGGLAVYARPWGERYLLDQTLDAIAGNSPLHDTLDLLVGVMGAEILEGDGMVCFPDAETGALRTRASAALGPHQRAETDIADTPWNRAMRTGEPQWSSLHDLGPELAAEAAARGHQWCWAWPVTTQDGRSTSGCLVLWRKLDEAPDHTCRASLDRLVRLTALLFEREAAAGALRFAARHDALTGLANRAAFFEQLQDVLDADDDGTSVGVLYVDLDGFKPINDRLGHGVGDAVLVQVAARLRTAVRAEDLVARIGGDEFTVLCPRIGHGGELEALAERLLDAIGPPIVVGDTEVRVGASMGIAAAAPGTCSIDVLIDAADQALYQVKTSRKGGWHFGSPAH